MSNPTKKSSGVIYTMYEDDIDMIAMSMNIDNIARQVAEKVIKKETEHQSKHEAAEAKEAEKLKKDKRKLKKDRQKEKKNQAKSKKEVKTEDIVSKSEQSAKSQNGDTDTDLQENEEDTDSQNMSDNENSDSADIDFSTIVPAFIQSIVNQKDIVKKQHKKHDSGKGKDSSKNVNNKVDAMIADDTSGFTSVKKGTKHTPLLTYCKTPEGFGNEALRLIRENEFESAIQCLNRGIALDRNDSRHYINRSYCCLRMGNYKQALDDIQYVNSHLTDIHEMSRAKCREGQALSGLQDYDAAEDAFRESINLAPDFLFAKRELKRTQIMRILDLGFKERSAILALDQKTTTMDAITLLSEESLTTTSCDSSESPDEDDENDDDIYYSDTEDDPSNVRLLSKLLKYNPNMPEEPYIPEVCPPFKESTHNHCQISRTPSQDPPLRIFKAVAPVAKPKKTNHGINEMAVWIGSLTPLIKDEMIIKRFSRFGKVTGIWRQSPNEQYAFINFQSTIAAQKALEEGAFGGGTIEINGFKLPIKPATSKTKTIK